MNDGIHVLIFATDVDQLSGVSEILHVVAESATECGISAHHLQWNIQNGHLITTLFGPKNRCDHGKLRSVVEKRLSDAHYPHRLRYEVEETGQKNKAPAETWEKTSFEMGLLHLVDQDGNVLEERYYPSRLKVGDRFIFDTKEDADLKLFDGYWPKRFEGVVWEVVERATGRIRFERAAQPTDPRVDILNRIKANLDENAYEEAQCENCGNYVMAEVFVGDDLLYICEKCSSNDVYLGSWVVPRVRVSDKELEILLNKDGGA